jgi:hypothetical protein
MICSPGVSVVKRRACTSGDHPRLIFFFFSPPLLEEDEGQGRGRPVVEAWVAPPSITGLLKLLLGSFHSAAPISDSAKPQFPSRILSIRNIHIRPLSVGHARAVVPLVSHSPFRRLSPKSVRNNLRQRNPLIQIHASPFVALWYDQNRAPAEKTPKVLASHAD